MRDHSAGRRRAGTDPRVAAARVLLEVSAGRRADAALERHARGLRGPDRALAQEITFGALRWKALLDARLDALLRRGLGSVPLPVQAILEVAAYQLLFLDRVPARAAIHEAVEGVRALLPAAQAAGLTAVVNATLRRLAVQAEGERGAPAGESPATDDPAELARLTSHPLWLVERWIARFGAQRTRAILAANNVRPAVHLRAHAGRVTPEELAERLRDDGADAELHSQVAGCVVLGGGDPTSFVAYREGLFSVQDAGAQLAARLVEAPESGLVVDVCAAPGGKLGAVAERPRASTFVAADVSRARLLRLDQTARRMGLPLRTVVADARTLALARAADLAIADVPCLGTGTFRRRVDARWQKSPERLPELTELQRGIAGSAADLLAPGGRLLYATCSLEPEENEAIVEWLLHSRPELAVLDVGEGAPGSSTVELPGGGGALFVTPEGGDWDGAFAAVLERR